MIDDWSTYSLSDFLMFSPDTYWRMVATYVGDFWILQLAVYLAAVGILWFVYHRNTSRLASLFLASIWLLPAYSFFLERYATIMLAAPYFAGLFAAQATLLLLEATRRRPSPGLNWKRSIPLIAFALVTQPLTGFLLSRDNASFEGLGLMPDTTAVFSLGVLLLIGARFWVTVIPIFWLMISALTLYAMEDAAWIIPVVIILYSVGMQVLPLGKTSNPADAT